MSEQTISIPRASDRAIVDCFRKLAVIFDAPPISISAAAFCHMKEVDLCKNGNDELESLLKHESTLIENCTLTLNGLQISYYRGGYNLPNGKSPFCDSIRLCARQNEASLSNDQKLTVAATINSELMAFEPGRFVKSGLTEEQTQLLSIHSSTLERLEHLNEHLVKESLHKTLIR